MNVSAICQPLRLILSDVDGVMTDGGITLDADGRELKRFNVRDGLGVRLWQRSGGQFGIITARKSAALAKRAAELDIEILHQASKDKVATGRQILEELELSPEQVAYIGDDLPDLGMIQLAGFGVAVADAAETVKAAASHVTKSRGGQGAIREMVEFVLQQQGKLEPLFKQYEANHL